MACSEAGWASRQIDGAYGGKPYRAGKLQLFEKIRQSHLLHRPQPYMFDPDGSGTDALKGVDIHVAPVAGPVPTALGCNDFCAACTEEIGHALGFLFHEWWTFLQEFELSLEQGFDTLAQQAPVLFFDAEVSPEVKQRALLNLITDAVGLAEAIGVVAGAVGAFEG